MTFRTIPHVCALALAAAIAACGSGNENEAEVVVTPPEQINMGANEFAEANAAAVDNAAAAPAVEPPPVVVNSPAYRCDDGDPLYVDVMSDENVVSVRDRRQDIPVRLTRESAGQSFTGDDGRSLSGTGDSVRYNAPDRENQSCRLASG